MFLKKTVEDILSNIKGDTEILVGLDGKWADPKLEVNERVNILHYPESIGQRAITNRLASLSKAKYVMKCDAHCAFDKGFDIKMIKEMHDDWTMVPTMKNLHVFDWVCKKCKGRKYQGPTPTECWEKKCDGKKFEKDILWRPKPSPNSVSYCFDSTPHFQYFGDFAKRPEGKGDITETMSLQGSCWMLTRDKYWELNVCDEDFGSWGSQGIEVAVKTWLSGGKVMVNKKTWYAHTFRTQGGDFGFPYPMSGSQQRKAKTYAKDLFFNDNWPQQIRPLSWLVEKFWPVRGWTDKDLKKLKDNSFKFSDKGPDTKPAESEPQETKPSTTSKSADRYLDKPVEELANKGVIYSSEPTKGIIFYTDNQLKIKIAHNVQNRLRQISKDLNIPIVSASLKPMEHFGDKNIPFPHLERGYLTMFKQILAALEDSTAEVIFFCEHDILYHPTHFDFIPSASDKFFYNENVWKLNTETGHAVHYECRQVSGICVYRDLAIKHYRERVSQVEKNGFTNKMGFEPGTHNRKARVDNLKSEGWMSKFPIVDIRHGKNLSRTRWKKEEFRNQKFTRGWTETDDEIPGWGKTKDLIEKLS